MDSTDKYCHSQSKDFDKIVQVFVQASWPHEIRSILDLRSSLRHLSWKDLQTLSDDENYEVVKMC